MSVELAAAILSLTMPVVGIVGVIWLVVWFGQKKRIQVHETVRKALDSGADPNGLLETIDQLSNPAVGDLRKGVISLAIAGAFVLWSALDLNVDALIAGMFPLAVGGAYLFLHWQRNRQSIA